MLRRQKHVLSKSTTPFAFYQRRQRNDKSKMFAFLRGGHWGAERKIVKKNAAFRGKRHDNKILKVQILLSRNFVVIAQAPNLSGNKEAILFVSLCSLSCRGCTKLTLLMLAHSLKQVPWFETCISRTSTWERGSLKSAGKRHVLATQLFSSRETREGWNCRFQKTSRLEGGNKVWAVSTQGSRKVCLSRCPKS